MGVSEARSIMLVTTSLMRGGAENQVFLIASVLARRGHTVNVVSLRDAEAYLPELATLGVPFTSLRMRRGLPDLRAVWRLGRLIRKVRPDVVHSHMVHANLLARVSRLVARFPVQISTAHSMNEGARWREVAYRLTDPLCTLTTNVCAAAVERFVRVGAVPADRIRRVPNGLDPTGFGRDDMQRQQARRELGLDDRFVWLAVGRLEDVKDYPTLLRAVASIKDEFPALTLLIVSDGTRRDSLEQLRNDVGLTTQQVRFLGGRDDVPALMSAADAYVMSSLWEGLPMVLLEAAAAELPIVATRVGGNGEVVKHGRNGYLLEPSEPDALAGFMVAMMRLPEEGRRRFGKNGREHVVEEFHIERVVDTWLEIYDEHLEAERRRAR